jgi:broad specificity phosphatase PhoE
VFLTGVNAFQGKQQPVDHFDRTVRLFFAKMGSYPNLITRLHTLINVLKNLKGMRFVNASAVFVFDQEDRNREPKLFFTHFDRVTYDENFEPDTDIVRSLRHLLYMMRTEWGEKVPTVYLIRHGERQDYCDKEWAPKSTHPHDAPLSPAGVVQSHDLVDRLCNIRPHLIVSSPFQRAIMFLEPLARRLQTSIVVEPGICEFLCQKTRKRMPRFISDTVTISPWLDTEYVPYWKTLTLETWEKVFDRTKETVDHLLKECEGKGDLVIVSHRSTLQTVFACIVPNFTGDTKLEYAGTAMLVRDVDGTWIVQTFNELNYLQHRIESPSSNPWRHIEGYYEDMDWNLYKSTSKMDAHPTAAAK